MTCKFDAPHTLVRNVDKTTTNAENSPARRQQSGASPLSDGPFRDRLQTVHQQPIPLQHSSRLVTNLYEPYFFFFFFLNCIPNLILKATEHNERRGKQHFKGRTCEVGGAGDADKKEFVIADGQPLLSKNFRSCTFTSVRLVPSSVTVPGNCKS